MKKSTHQPNIPNWTTELTSFIILGICLRNIGNYWIYLEYWQMNSQLKPYSQHFPIIEPPHGIKTPEALPAFLRKQQLLGVLHQLPEGRALWAPLVAMIPKFPCWWPSTLLRGFNIIDILAVVASSILQLSFIRRQPSCQGNPITQERQEVVRAIPTLADRVVSGNST